METSHINDFALSFEKKRLSYCGQDCQKIPSALWKMYGSKVTYLDLSYNSIETLKGLENFTELEELILDNNKIGDSVCFPLMPRLRTLSINNNQITDLDGLINKISVKFPSLTYLSLLSNKACPNQLSDLDKDDNDYQRYSAKSVFPGLPASVVSGAAAGGDARRVHARAQTRCRRPGSAAALRPVGETLTCRLQLAGKT
ncbi:leucine-rich melanocyte differentiation-associated protein-like isoform X2 [Maniola jurtina]|uniref:leucine-rich melanocyte differentiation-associated protein-like isoform X2 n=1 Tax=Maniola jurtina TaxID=191418 RepID=UPI001E68CD63|nr:leucine-rich melanocyte differentiation-associated protein-like isoform X2 [Maniola jurtina]